MQNEIIHTICEAGHEHEIEPLRKADTESLAPHSYHVYGIDVLQCRTCGQEDVVDEWPIGTKLIGVRVYVPKEG